MALISLKPTNPMATLALRNPYGCTCKRRVDHDNLVVTEALTPATPGETSAQSTIAETNNTNICDTAMTDAAL